LFAKLHFCVQLGSGTTFAVKKTLHKKGKIKYVPVIKHGDALWLGGKAPLTLHLVTWWKLGSFTLWPLCPRGKSPGKHSI